MRDKDAAMRMLRNQLETLVAQLPPAPPAPSQMTAPSLSPSALATRPADFKDAQQTEKQWMECGVPHWRRLHASENAETPAVVAVQAFREFALTVMRMRMSIGGAPSIGISETFQAAVRGLMTACRQHGPESEIKAAVLIHLSGVLDSPLAPEPEVGGGRADASRAHEAAIHWIVVELKKGNGIGAIQAAAYFHQHAMKMHDSGKWGGLLRGGFQLPCLIVVIEAYTLQIWAGHVGQGSMCEPLATISLIDTPDNTPDACAVLWAARQCVAALRRTYEAVVPSDSSAGPNPVNLPHDYAATGRLRWMAPILPTTDPASAAGGDEVGAGAGAGGAGAGGAAAASGGAGPLVPAPELCNSGAELRSFPDLCGLDAPPATGDPHAVAADIATVFGAGMTGLGSDPGLGVVAAAAPVGPGAVLAATAVGAFASVSNMRPVMRRYGSHMYSAKHAVHGDCIVKFFVASEPEALERYWLLAAGECIVPRLYAFARLSPVWCVAVMERLMTHGTMNQVASDPTKREEWVAAAKGALQRLHGLDLVHGDARPCNVLVPADPTVTPAADKVRLIDLDWCCRADSGRRYTDELNVISVPRPEGARPGKLMTAELDMEQVGLFDPPRGEAQ